ncbi:polysaccharide export outer membrane protein [Parabacteroides sp. PFB2-10]|uniref:polysaccharide biosynthesis/export family protein n=1 Tax=Parabacteroides sp. PFB2-10 TaxID=1742405 RepID=UPI0024764857|nr:polysaccharide biosynthesis/export family protein [Parabacteroides sp. PFB2-10]MDH6313535.1 polysaccharide export outer membrane protein [Parabacteroides sp. PFB2-10]
MRLKVVSLSFLILVLASCGTPKDVAYLQGIDDLTVEQLKSMSQAYETKIVPDDLLTIAVTSWDPNAATPFNPPAYAYSAPIEGETTIQSTQNLYTYLVDKEGYIDFPVLGKVKAEGYTRQQLGEYLKEKISDHIEKPLVKVQIVNFHITILGEVNRPGTITPRSDRLSILDALGSVGDLTINADRKNILVMREENGELVSARLDLTRSDMLASPYFYLKQNDFIYVEPNDAKKKNARYSQAQQYSITVFSSILSAISVITTVILAISK